MRNILRALFVLTLFGGALHAATNWKAAGGTDSDNASGIWKQTGTFFDAGATGRTMTQRLTSPTGYIEVEDACCYVRTAFDRTTDGGPSAQVIDIGTADAGEFFAKDLDMQALGQSCGSGTSGVKPKTIVTSPLVLTYTVTATGANLNLPNAGLMECHIKHGPAPNLMKP